MIVFINPGEIDVRAITAFGVNAKENDSSIGQFGTGLKYAIAILLRHGCSITIHSGLTTYNFETKTEELRGKTFEFVYINGKQLGFTTELGKHWEMWMAFREIACNCMDERGEFYKDNSGKSIRRAKGETKVIVTGRPFEQAYENRAEVLLQTRPLLTSHQVEFHSGPSNSLYYKGVKVNELSKPSKYTYNITSPLLLTEDRTLLGTYQAELRIATAIMQLQDKEVIRELVTAPYNTTYEGRMSYSGAEMFIRAPFENTVKELVANFNRQLNPSARAVCRLSMLNSLPDESETVNEVDAKRLERAIKILAMMDFDVKEFPIVITSWLGEGIMGQAAHNKIYLSHLAFRMGTKALAGTLLEEYLHLKYEVMDYSPSMQNLLIDTIMSMGEQLTGEPV